MDVIEMDAATNRGIEEVRDLRDRVKYAPALGRYKVYIIDEVHMLTTEAFNALLKTLEEPPAHVIFILATTEPQKIPATIISRCQRFDFRPLTEDLIATHLQSIAQQTGVNLNQEAANILAFRAQGGMRDAIGLLEQVIAFAQQDITPEQVWQALGTVDKARLVELVSSMAAKDIGAVLKLLDEFGNMGLDFRQLLTDLLELLREKLLQVTGARKTKTSDDLGLKTAPEIMTMMDSVASGLQDSRRWTHPRLATELIMIKICNSLKSGPVREQKQPPAVKSPKKVKQEKPVAGEKWDDVLSLVKGESISSYAWLKEATPFIEADSLVLEYPGNYGLHCENIVKPEHRQVLVLAFRQVLGIDVYTVRTRE
jgi:DNA polymerase-3 subunit gamma/tau